MRHYFEKYKDHEQNKTAVYGQFFKKKKTTFWNLNEIMNETLNGLTSGKLKFC